MMKVTHGGDIYSRDVKWDFSANINPLGMPPGVRQALIDGIDRFERYPDIRCAALKQAIAAHENIVPEKIVCGNGAADLIYRAVQVIQPKQALIMAPTFSEYERALRSVGCEVSHYFLSAENGFAATKEILRQIPGKDMVILCHPNNPVGNLIEPDLLARIADTCHSYHVTLMVDECFLDFTFDGTDATVYMTEQMLVLKAFTKIYAMAGLRLGYLLCGSQVLVEKIQSCGQCWSVSVPAQIAGIAALRETDYVRQTVRLIAEERAYLTRTLKSYGFQVFPSEVNFLLFQCELPLDQRLIKKGIAIRNCSDYPGLTPGYFRIAVRTHEENRLLVNTIARCLERG